MTTLEKLAARLPHNRGPALLSMFEHGEARLGLEMIVENLYEFDIAVTGEEEQLLRRLASETSLDPKFVDLIDQLHVDD